MLSSTGLFATQPSRFEEFENSQDYLSYEPLSDLSLSSASSLPDLSNHMNTSFQGCFVDSEALDCMNNWNSQTSLPVPDTTSWEPSKFDISKDLHSPFQSPMIEYSLSPTSSDTSDGDYSPTHSSSNHSISFEDDFYLDFLSKPSNIPTDLADPKTTSTETPSQQYSPSPSTKIPDFSQEEIANLWATAFPEPLASPSSSQLETTSPNSADRPSTLEHKRKSTFENRELSTASKKRHVEEKEPRRYSKRAASAASTRPHRGSKLNHNLIEKRYRSSLNDKIALLRDALPRTTYGNSPHTSDEDEVAVKGEDQEEFDSQASEAKQSTKGAVLSDAAKYIRYLEEKVNRLEKMHACVSAF